MLRFAAKQHYQLIYEILIGYALVFCGEHFKGCHSVSSLMSSSRAEMRIISRMAISRLGRLNSIWWCNFSILEKLLLIDIKKILFVV